MRSSSWAAVAAIAAGVCIAAAPEVLAIAVPLGVGWVVLRILVSGVTQGEDDDARTRLATWVGVGLAAHLLVGWVGHTTNIAADSVFYNRVAQQIVDHWRHSYPFEALPRGKEGFFYLLAVLYRIFGHYPAVGVVTNCVFAAVTVPVVYDTTKRLFGAEAARFVGPVMLLPGFLLWTSILLREAAILLLMAVAVNAAVRLSDRLGAGRFAVMAGALTLLFTFRANVALLLMASILPALALSRRKLVTGIGTGVTVTALVLVLVVGAGVGYSGYQLTSGASLERVEVSRNDLSTSAGSGYAQGADVSTTKGALTYLPVGLFNFMLGPFPWQARGARQLIALPDVLIWWALLPALWRGTRHAIRLTRRKSLLLLLPAGLIAVMLSLIVGNFGTAIRERLQVIVVIVPLIAFGLACKRPNETANIADTPIDVPGVSRPLATL